MSQRITDFRVDKIEIREDRYYALPINIRTLIETYARPLKSIHSGYFRFELPIYRWAEIETAMGCVREHKVHEGYCLTCQAEWGPDCMNRPSLMREKP